MPRTHARMQTSRWRDGDWRALTISAQHTYDVICQQETISHCGVIDYFPGRIADLSKDNTTRKVEAAIKELEAERFVVLDRNTSELLIRTFVKHDGVLDRVNMGKAMARALAKVVSMTVRDAVMDELARCYRDDNRASGWVGFQELYPDDFESVKAMASRMPLRMASGM